MTQALIIATIIAYLAVMIVIGFYFNRKGERSSEGFYLGGRKLGPLVTAMSAEASDMSSWLLMGLPGVAYMTGLSDAFWTAFGLFIGTYLNWLFVAKRLRRYSAKLNAITVPDFFSRRYRDEKNILSCIAALAILVFFVPYTASGFKAVGTLFNSLFGVDYHTAMVVGAVVIVLYTVLGGFLAVSTTDLIQSIVMSVALVVIVFFGISLAGGFSAVTENAASMEGFMSFTKIYDMSSGSTSSYGFLTIISTMAWGLGYFGMPHILLRFMAARSEKDIPVSRRIGSVWVIISMGVAILIGIIGNAVSKTGAIPVFNASSDAETVVIRFADILSNKGVIAAIIAGLVLAGILACTMSTADSQLLSAGSSVSKNLMQDFFRIKMDDKKQIVAARAVIIVIAIVSMFLAWNPDSSVFQIVSFAWAGFGGAFGPLMLLSLFWKRTNLPGALAGMVSGGVMVFVWKYLVRPLGGAWNIYELLPAFLVSLIVIIVVSLLTKKPSDDIVNEFEDVRANRV